MWCLTDFLEEQEDGKVGLEEAVKNVWRRME